MKLLEGIGEFKSFAGESVVTIGVFDGVHRGHQQIISETVRSAGDISVPSVLMTFKRNPRQLIRGDHPCVITPQQNKMKLIESFGVDFTAVIAFDKEFASMSPEEFCSRVLYSQLGARKVCVGENFRFGSGGTGNIEMLSREGRRLGFAVSVVPLLSSKGSTLSSTLIRSRISKGDVRQVMEDLGRPYSVVGEVVHGHSRGKSLGFPTANLKLARRFCVPLDGVYAGKSLLGSRKLECAVNVGSNPTFGDIETAIEVFLMDFAEEIYGESLEVEFHERLRDELAFRSEAELVEQMKMDVRTVKELLE